MTKRIMTTLAVTLTVGFVSGLVLAQANPRGEATLGGGKVTIDYGRPSAKGRDVMGMITPGSYWRMGADAATTITTQVDLKVGDTTVPKGTYTLVAHFVEKDKWNLVVAGSVGPGYKPEGVVAEVPGRLETGKDPVEQLTISLEEHGDKGTLVLAWTTYRLSADFEIGA